MKNSLLAVLILVLLGAIAAVGMFLFQTSQPDEPLPATGTTTESVTEGIAEPSPAEPGAGVSAPAAPATESPAVANTPTVACTQEVMECPDGTFVGRGGPDCAFAACPTPSAPVACTQEVKECPDGTFVGRGGPDCAFAACPTPSAPVACTQEVKECPDGSFVGRGEPDCEFAACPSDAPAMQMELQAI
jgi:hypothetical protein